MNRLKPGAGLAAALLLFAAMRWLPPLAWLAAAPLFAACRDRRTDLRGAARTCVEFALVVALLGHQAWLAATARHYFDFSPAASAAIALALCIGCALPYGLTLGLGLGSAARLPGTILPVVAGGASFVAAESLTRAIVPYYPWIGLAATQSELPTVVQLASVGGQWAVSFVVAGFGCALALVREPADARMARDGAASSTSSTAPRVRAAALAVALAAGTLLFGRARLAGAPAATDAGERACAITAADAGIESGDLDPAVVIARYADVTRRAASARPDAIVWPESALPHDPLAKPELLATLRGLARDGGFVLLAGGPRTAYDAGWAAHHFNSLFRIAADGPVEVYDKREPVPFAERWPRGFGAMPAWLDLDPVVEGTSASEMRFGGCTVGVLLCFEVERPGLAASAAASGADALVVASNDADLPATAIATELAESRLRAVETGLPLLRAANRGASVAIDRYGRATPARDGLVTMIVRGAAEPAPAVRWASRVLALCWLTFAAAVLAARGRRASVPRAREPKAPGPASARAASPDDSPD